MLDKLTQLSNSNRIIDLERRSEGNVLRGDFEGSVTAYWVRLGPKGEGIVSYNNKQYVTNSIGFVSIPAGTEVELSYANGMYYTSF